MARLRWLLVGAGDIAQKRVAPALANATIDANAANATIDAICSRTREHAQALADKFGVKSVFTDFQTALSASSADAVYLATPVGLHARHAIASLKAGKHVLVEKPLALNGEQAREIVRAAEGSGKRAGCAYYRRCYPRYQHARKMLEKGEFGRVVLVRLTYFGWFAPAADDPKRWRVVQAESGGGALADIGSHMLDLVIGLFGLPRTVFAQCSNLVHEWDVEDTSSILMTLANGAHAVAAFGWNSKTWRHEMEIVGTEAKLWWHPFDTGPVIKTVGRNTEEIAMPNAENVHQPLVQDFLEAVRTGREPVCPVAEAAKTSFVLDAVYQSAREKRPVSL